MPRQDGGSISYNILLLCPNFHTKLDDGDEFMIERSREALLFKSMKRLMREAENSNEGLRKLCHVARAIILRHPL